MKLRHTAPCYTKILTELYDEGRSQHVKNPQEFALMNWLVKMQDTLLKAAAQGFISHYKAIMDGTFEHELIFDSQAEVLLRSLKGIAFDYAFTSMSIYKTEIAANSIITYLLDKLVPAALEFDGEKAPGLMEKVSFAYFRKITGRYTNGQRPESLKAGKCTIGFFLRQIP